MSLAGLLLGVINVAIVVAVLVLIGLVIVWFCGWMGLAVPDQLKKVYMIIVALVGLYLLVALLLGLPGIGPIHLGGRAAAPPFLNFASTTVHLQGLLT